ncbi:MAG: hypothetical protein NTX72_06095 [Candidatus Uhrbacteria bacterium]|nr:hypothetical protein [Candidatus Uhrbacteria bacterium]
MSQFYTNVVTILHANLVLDGLTKNQVIDAKRKNVVANGGKPAVDAAAKLVEAGITAEYLCPDGKLLGLDTMAKVADLIENGASVTALQQFSPSEILAGLNEVQLASLKPTVEVVAETEAPVAEVEVVADTVVAEAAPEAPVVKVVVKAEPEQMYTCAGSGRKATAQQLRIAPLHVLKAKLGQDLLTEQNLIDNAYLPLFTQWKDERNSLANGLSTIRAGQAKHAEAEAQKANWASFCKGLKYGEVGEYNGTLFRRCSYYNTVFKACDARFPALSVIKDNTRNGITPTPDAAATRFTCGPRKQQEWGMTVDNSLSFEELVACIKVAEAEEAAQRKSAEMKRDRLAKQQVGSNRGQQMSKADELAGLDEYRKNQDAWTGARRERGSRGDQSRRASEELIDDMR